MADIGRELAEAVAPGTLLTGDRVAAHRVAGVAPRFVAAPVTVAGVSRVLRVAGSQRLAVIPTGAGARLGWGAPRAGWTWCCRSHGSTASLPTSRPTSRSRSSAA